MKQQNYYSGFWLMTPLLLIAIIWMLLALGGKKTELSNGGFMQLLADGGIQEVEIYQNEQAPTGEVRVTTDAGRQFVVYVSDVNETQ